MQANKLKFNPDKMEMLLEGRRSFLECKDTYCEWGCTEGRDAQPEDAFRPKPIAG